jgi:hypothetical protein
MTFIDDLQALELNQGLNFKNNSLMNIILKRLPIAEKDALMVAVNNKLISAQSIADLLTKNGHPISSDSVRRFRRKLNINVVD